MTELYCRSSQHKIRQSEVANGTGSPIKANTVWREAGGGKNSMQLFKTSVSYKGKRFGQN